MMRPHARFAFALILLTTIGCATAPLPHHQRAEPAQSAAQSFSTGTTGATESQSAVEIVYVLGHNHRAFKAEASTDGVSAATYVDHQILERGAVDPAGYAVFIAKARSFIEAQRAAQVPGAPGGETRAPATGGGASTGATPSPTANSAMTATGEPCRMPFTVTLRGPGENLSVTGCRQAGQSGISRLVRDGEFLLYSKR